MEGYDQILYLSDLIVPNGELWSNIKPTSVDLIATNGVAWSNIVPQWPDSTKWIGMVKYCTFRDLVVPNREVWSKYCTSVTWYHQMERYGHILYLRDLIGTKWRGGVSNIIPQWPGSIKWRGMVNYCTSVTLIAPNWRGMVKYCTLVTW